MSRSSIFASALLIVALLVAVLLLLRLETGRRTLGGCSLDLSSVPLTTPTSNSSGAGAASRPNILIIIADDQPYDTMDFMPNTKALIFDQGCSFANAYVTTPVCCPSRSSILTGMYAHNHGVHRNEDPLLKETFVERLHASGYYTGQVGKYLNSWEGSARPEFDFWVAIRGRKSPYFDPELNVNGVWGMHPGYITYILRDYALEFLRRAAGQDKPFLLLFAPNAPHGGDEGPAEPVSRNDSAEGAP